MHKKFHALADELRLRLIALLQEGELCVCEIMRALQMGQSKISFHMGILKEAGIVKDRPDSKWVHYSLNGEDEFCSRFLAWILEELNRSPQTQKDRQALREILIIKAAKKAKSLQKSGVAAC